MTTQPKALLEDDLEYIELAHQLNKKHHTKLRENKLHFRGNVNSFSLISLAKETPECGIPNLRTKKNAEAKLKVVLESSGVEQLIRPPLRVTPEKELQAWLIQNALENDRALKFDPSLRFITSELALGNDGKRVVNDILALDTENNLVVVELKSTRAKKQIEAQVEAFMQIIKQERLFFKALVTLIMEKEWSGEVHGMVVWNGISRTKRKIRKEYREVCYMETAINGQRCIDYDAQGNIQFKELT